MYISKQWLQEFVDIKNIPPQEIAKRLTLSTVEVENVRVMGQGLEQVVVGIVKSVEKHSNADKLSVCRVDIGKKELQIVCGGSNVHVGMKVALAQIGAKVRWHGQGDLVELKPVEIRGVASEGMICASDEIGLGEMYRKTEEKEILDLSGIKAKVGTPLAKALGFVDVVFEIDNKSLSHRSDLWGHVGIAREVSALFNKTVRPYKTPSIPKGKGVKLSVEIEEKKLCARYMAVCVHEVVVAPSPAWMQSRLQACGVRPINNIVDITNYVMLELGQPMHAFDASHFKTKRIVVRKAKNGEVLKALDGKEFALTKEMLVIADTAAPIAIAGIMGGEESSVNEETTMVILESATFDASSIRRTSNALGLRSESSARFEKGLTVERAELALRRAIALMLELCPNAKVASAVVDKKQVKTPKRFVDMSSESVERVLGLSIPFAITKQILIRLGFGVVRRGQALRVVIPNWRSEKDISIPADIIEEVIRIHGFSRIRPSLPLFSIVPPVDNPLRTLEYKMKQLLAHECGFTETYNYSFVSPELLEKIGLNLEDHFELGNPIAKDRPYIRRNLFPNMLENVEANLHRFDAVRLFETGHVYVKDDMTGDLPAQDLFLGLAYAAKETDIPFYAIAGAMQRVFTRLNISLVFRKDIDVPPWQHPGRAAHFLVGEAAIGWMGELHPFVAKKLGIESRVAILEMNLNALLPHLGGEKFYRPIPPYPRVTRDIAFVVSKEIAHIMVVEALQKISPLIVGVELFDVYEGKNIPAGKKSIAFHIVYQSSDRTLEAGEVDKIVVDIEKALVSNFFAEIRR